MTELDRLRRLLDLVRAMRVAQNEYFKSKRAGMPAHNELKAAREIEKDVDALIRELDDTDPQGKLF